MKVYIVEQTEKTPMVKLDHENNTFLIKGMSILREAEALYGPIIEWIEEYGRTMVKPLIFEFELDFFNIQSSRKILRVLYKLEELYEQGLDVSVKWSYADGKDHIYEAGKDYAYMVNIPFEFNNVSFPADNKELVNY